MVDITYKDEKEAGINLTPSKIKPFSQIKVPIDKFVPHHPKNSDKVNNEKENSGENQGKNKVKQEQIHDLLFSRKVGWQEIIYDLINTEQLDPWDVDIIILTDRYLEKIKQLEEADFYISSKVLLAAALLLKIKSEMLLTHYIKSIDEILFGKKEEKKEKKQERIELEEEIPDLVPRSPMPRRKQVTLNELVQALDKAIKTENRRIKKVINNKNALRESSVSKPKKRKNVKDRITEIYDRLNKHFEESSDKSISFTKFIGGGKEEKIASFFPLLHLENQKEVWLQQEKHFSEIFIWLKEVFFKHNPDPFEELKIEVEESSSQDSEEGNKKEKNTKPGKSKTKKEEKKEKKRKKELEEKFSNPLGE